MNDTVERLINELDRQERSFVIIIGADDVDYDIELTTNFDKESATDMMIAALHELRFGEE